MHVRSCFLNPALATRQSLLSRDSRAAQRIEVPDHVGDSCFGCPSVGQPAESCLDGTLHMKSFGGKVVTKKLQPLTGPFCKTEHLGAYGGHGASIGAVCDPTA